MHIYSVNMVSYIGLLSARETVLLPKWVHSPVLPGRVSTCLHVVHPTEKSGRLRDRCIGILTLVLVSGIRVALMRKSLKVPSLP